MKQTRLSSFIEQLLNIGSGFIISILVWIYIIMPVWNIEADMYDNLAITGIFTVVSIIRGYIWRRIFNQITHKKLVLLQEQKYDNI